MRRYIDARAREGKIRRGLAEETRKRAEAAARREHPDADEIRVGQYGDLIYVEVWRNHAADLYAVHGLDDIEPDDEQVPEEVTARRREAARKAVLTRQRNEQRRASAP